MNSTVLSDIKELDRTNGGSRIPDHPLFTADVHDPDEDLEAYICVHAMGRYGASGGLRCVDDVNREEAQLLAKAMTYKYSFFNIEQGGAKGVMKLGYDEPPERRRHLLRLAAVHLEPLIKKGVWSPWTDMNFYREDRAEFLSAIGINPPSSGGAGSSYRTALSAFAALQASVEWLRLSPEKVRIAIEGFGSVASFLAPMLKQYGVKLVALSTHNGGIQNPEGLDLDAVLACKRAEGSNWVTRPGPWKPIDRARLFAIETDIIIPCARVHSIDPTIAKEVSTRIVLPIANVPCTPEALEVFDRRQITYVPDYVVNGGGVCGHIMGDASPDHLSSASPFLDQYRPMVLRLLEAESATGTPARSLADGVANSNYASITRGAYDRPSTRQRVVHLIRRVGARSLRPLGLAAARLDPATTERNHRRRRTIDHLSSLFR